MLFRKKCPGCGSKVNKNQNYCSYCGYPLKKKEDIGDFPFPKISMGSVFKLTKELMKSMNFNELMKEEKMRENKRRKDKEISRVNNGMGGISIKISSLGDKPIVKIKKIGDNLLDGIEETAEGTPKDSFKSKPKIKKLSKLIATKFAKLPKTEPATTVRRLANKIIYEIDLPGVKEKDIIINKLQDSIEIRAFTKNKAFLKIIPIALPILKHKLEQGKLILELQPES